MVRSLGVRKWWLLGVPACAIGAAVGPAQAQLMDGNLDALTPGTPPDCTTPAGAWQFPANYQTALLCEMMPTDFSVVATNTFDPTHTGNSLAVISSDNVDSMHLTNILATPIMPAPGQIVRIDFDLWVNATGGGATFYAGSDNGGGGYSNASDRGPQVSWFSDGSLQYNAAGINTILVPAYPRGQWQHVRLDIHFDTANYDFYWAAHTGQSLTTLGTGLGFRAATPPTFLDRISIAHFGATPGLDMSNCYYDNFTVALVTPSSCYANCDGSTAVPFLNVNDFICFQGRFAAGDSYANCDGSTSIPILNVNDFICFQSRFASGCSAP